MIKVKRIGFSYKEKIILEDLSLTIDRGEICSVLGLNGSGKTTLIRILSRLLEPSCGSIEIDSAPSSSYSPKEYAKKISLLPQSRDVPSISVYDFIASGRYPYLGFSGKPGAVDLAAIGRAIKMTDTDRLLCRNLKELSGGERQRVYLAMVLAQDTPYVLLDEPTTHLDAASSFEFHRLTGSLKELGKGILSVSHDLSSAFKHSDKILLLREGRTAFYGSPSDSRAILAIEELFQVRCIEHVEDREKEYFFTEQKIR